MRGEREWIPRSGTPRIAQRLRERRRALGLTQAELAGRVGLARTAFVLWEKGRLPNTIAAAKVSALKQPCRCRRDGCSVMAWSRCRLPCPMPEVP
jgi:DNA-binding XRE family transcriptional regulator